MDSWSVHLDRDIHQRLDEHAFVEAVSHAATELVTARFARVKEL